MDADNLDEHKLDMVKLKSLKDDLIKILYGSENNKNLICICLKNADDNYENIPTYSNIINNQNLINFKIIKGKQNNFNFHKLEDFKNLFFKEISNNNKIEPISANCNKIYIILF